MSLSWIKKVYLYLVSLISLIILVIAGIMLINLALSSWVFTKADDDYYSYPEKPFCGDIPEPAIMDKTEASIIKDPRCDNPNWQEDEKQREQDRRTAQKQRNASQAIAMILVAAPVFLYHWKLARKES